jgi:hypothetical protein
VALILFGAEVIQAYATDVGSVIRTANHAVRQGDKGPGGAAFQRR